MKQVFVAATRQNDGKTMVSLGLFSAFQNRFKNVAYMKPVGQQYRLIDGNKIDKDAVLFRTVYDLKDHPLHMSPIAVPRGFTEEYILNASFDRLKEKLLSAYKALTHEKELLLIEGTGHAGVGSVFDMSNAVVAKQTGAKVTLVSLGGVGRAIDEIMLNKAVFDMNGVELAGVIINKVKKDKFDKVTPLIRKGLERQGIRVFGTIPYVDKLTRPTVGGVFEELKGEVVSECDLNQHVDHCVIGDMVPHDALNSISENSLLILPANREGLIMSALAGIFLDDSGSQRLSGIVFTNGKRPHLKVMQMLQRANIPVTLVKEDSFTVATEIHRMLVKVTANEQEKIKTMQSLIEEYVDVEALISAL
jgi:BioD-like phosphotransacetylase family protein